MTRNRIHTKEINGKTYYTSAYLADEYFIADRTARKYLEDLPSLADYPSPKFYTKEVMEQAIKKIGKSPEELERIREQRRLSEAESIEEKIREQNHTPLTTPITSKEELSLNKAIKDNIDKLLPLKMFEQFLFVQGYTFDIEQFQNDVVTVTTHENYIPETEERTPEIAKAFERIYKPNSDYLKKFK